MHIRKRVLFTLLAITLATLAVVMPLPTPKQNQHLTIEAINKVDGIPATWHNCQISIDINTTYAPPGALEDVNDILNQIEQNTNLTFNPRNTTNTIPQDITTPEKNRTNIILAWGNKPGTGQPESYSTYLNNIDLAGRAGTITEWQPQRILREAANNILQADAVIDQGAPKNMGGKSGHRGWIYHELGHTLGLGHANNPKSIMNENGIKPGEWTSLNQQDIQAFNDITKNCTKQQ